MKEIYISSGSRTKPGKEGTILITAIERKVSLQGPGNLERELSFLLVSTRPGIRGESCKGPEKFLRKPPRYEPLRSAKKSRYKSTLPHRTPPPPREQRNQALSPNNKR